MITDVQRIVVKRNNTEIKTNTLILTFNTPKIPDSLKICYLNISVLQYVPNPIRIITGDTHCRNINIIQII